MKTHLDQNNNESAVNQLLEVVREMNQLSNILGYEDLSKNPFIDKISASNIYGLRKNSEKTPNFQLEYFKTFDAANKYFDNILDDIIGMRTQIAKTSEGLQDQIKNEPQMRLEISRNKELLDFIKTEYADQKQDLVNHISSQINYLERFCDAIHHKIQAASKLINISFDFSSIVLDNRDLIVQVMDESNFEETIHFEGGFLTQMNDVPKIKVVVADTFEPNVLSVTELILDELNKHLAPECKNEGYMPTCLENVIQTHGIEVASIITNLVPNVALIPKEYFNDDHIQNMQELYGAKVINISSCLYEGLEESLIELAKDHIIVKSLGNHGNSLLSREPFFENILENEYIKKHMIFVGNVLPDGNTIHPTSGIPGANKTIQGMTVCAPGTWIPVQTLNTQTFEQYELAEKEAFNRDGTVLPPYNPSMTTSEYYGTSFATPVVTALVAHLITQFPMFSLTHIVELVKYCATNIGNSNVYGHGIINFSESFEHAADLRANFRDYMNYDLKLAEEVSMYGMVECSNEWFIE